MTIQECYERLGGNYKEAKQRLTSDRLVERFMLKFPDDKTMEMLEKAAAEGNVEESFRCAHTLKGVAANLSFTELWEAASVLTEQLRDLSAPADPVFLENVRKSWRKVIDGINEYKGERV